MNRRIFSHVVGACFAGVLLVAGPVAGAADEAPDALIKRTSTEVLDIIKADKAIQSGDTGKIIALVDGKVMPHVNFTRMTAATVGRNWRQATPEQQKRLQEEFKTLLVRTYSGALAQVKVETYRTQFAQEISTKGVDGLIAALSQRNKSNAGEKTNVGEKKS